MKLLLSNNHLYVDNVTFCLAGAVNGRTSIQPGRYPVETRFSEEHRAALPYAVGFGFLGADAACDIVLGRVHSGVGVIPCRDTVQRLLHYLELAEDIGEAVTMEVTRDAY